MTVPRHALALVALAAAALAGSACASRPAEIRVLPPRSAANPDVAAAAEPGAAPDAGTPGTAIARTAAALLGLPYREGGALPDGFDCSGLVSYVFARHGIAVPRDVRRQAVAGVAVARGDIAPGDLVFFGATASGPTHVGIAIGEGRFIHAPKTGDVVRTESLAAGYWTSRFVAARRVSAP